MVVWMDSVVGVKLYETASWHEPDKKGKAHPHFYPRPIPRKRSIYLGLG